MLEEVNTLTLANRLNQIMVEKDKHELAIMLLEKERNEVLKELKRRFPKLKNDENLKIEGKRK